MNAQLSRHPTYRDILIGHQQTQPINYLNPFLPLVLDSWTCSHAHPNQFCIHPHNHLPRTTIFPSSLNSERNYTLSLISLSTKGAVSYFYHLLLISRLRRYLTDLTIPTRSSSTQSTNCVNYLYFPHDSYWLYAPLSTKFQYKSHTYYLLTTMNLFWSPHR